ncbi:hypothetical protein Q8A73_018745 [Channa argus]|nr:hypothetical protein Q8A73_018745 [Channa argus]
MTIESNTTLDTQTILSTLNQPKYLQVNNIIVTILQNVPIADCLIIGPTTNCSCSPGFTWSNEVCYSFQCCHEAPCSGNVSNMPEFCVAKVNVQIYGSITLTQSNWTSNHSSTLQNLLAKINAFQHMKVEPREEKTTEFNASFSVRLNTSKLQDYLKSNFIGNIYIYTSGMVTIVSPNTSVCYESSPVLKCTFDEPTDSSGWTMVSDNQNFTLNSGTVVHLNNSCSTKSDPSCIQVTLVKVTDLWEGIYQCSFTRDIITHFATTQLSVVLLPDEVTMASSPVTVDCLNLKATDTVNISVTATIKQSRENYKVMWSRNGEPQNQVSNPSQMDKLSMYNFTTYISCNKSIDTYVTITFQNPKGQNKTTQLNIPVIYESSAYCGKDYEWPITPNGVTVTNYTCEPGREGYRTRSCIDSAWQDVVSFCVTKELIVVSNQAENFQKGLNATSQMAVKIFEGLLNNSVLPSSSTNNFADVDASIKVLNVMASASTITVLQQEVLPTFINAASNLLSNSWGLVNASVLYNMSSTYIQSVENLVKNIMVNNSTGVNSKNLELQFCSSDDCNMSLSDIGLSINGTNGTLKALAVKNLTDKLNNNYKEMTPNSMLVSVTLNNSKDLSLEIMLDFPNELLYNSTPLCVFWNTIDGNWSDNGCTVNGSDANHTVCICSHLTPFSVLMSKGKIPENSGILDVITNVGLGVSICSLLIFLIIESLVWSAVVKTHLSHFRHTAMVNIAMFLLLADCSFLATTSPKILSDNSCLLFTICKHLFYLGMFCWMLCMSFMLVHQLIFVFSPLRKRVFIIFSSFVGYVCPILIVGSTYAFCKYTKMDYYERNSCWLVYKGLFKGSIYGFLVPVGTVVLTNIFCMMVVILTLVKSAFPDGSMADDKDTAKSILKVVVCLTPVFGITWVIGFAQLILIDKNSLNLAKYSFTILNSFQGLFILLTGLLSEQRVRNELYRVIRGKSRGKSDSMKNLISSRATEK